MKVLLLITKAEIGGAQNFVLSLAKEFKKRNISVSVAGGEGNFLPQELDKNDISFHFIKNLKRSKNPFHLLFFVKELKKTIEKEKFDIIHFNSTNTLPGIIATKLSSTKPKTIFTIHGLSVLDPNYEIFKLFKKIFKLYFKIFLKYFDEIIFVSQHNLEEFLKQKITTKGKVIYNGVEINLLSDMQARNFILKKINLPITEKSFLIGSIGRIAYQKNYNFLIKNFTEILKIKPEAKLILIGDGPDKIKYENIIDDKNLKKHIFLLGEIKNASQILKGFDLFVLPSVYEGLSISLIEAYLADIKAMASDVGGNREIIGLENCFHLNDWNNFVEIFKEILIKEKPINNEEKFSVREMADKYIDVYKDNLD